MLVQAKTVSIDYENTVNANILPERIFETLWRAQQGGEGCLPWRLGLDPQAFEAMCCAYLPASVKAAAFNEHGHLRQVLLDLRHDEWQDLYRLLIAGGRQQNRLESWLAASMAAACLGANHLWRDMGLPNRDLLSALLKHYFPGLANKNIHNMRWKKFFYKQLCEAEGGYICRSPTCEQCTLYADCFGAES